MFTKPRNICIIIYKVINLETKRWKNRDALITGFDNYDIDVLAKPIRESKFMKRAKEKGMAKVQDPHEAHLTVRSTHMEQTAIMAKKLAEGLGLNEIVAYIGMLMHDAGHTFGSHEGEQAMNIIGILEGIGFFHHSAKGVDVVLGEDIIQSLINQVPDARENKELENKLREDVWYFLEIIVGHDGESTSKDIKKMAKGKNKYASIKEGVLAKVSKANRTNEYKCQVETLEAELSKPADILAYLKTDMLDAFSFKIFDRFSDNYSELIAQLLCETYGDTKRIKEEIENAENDIEKAKIEEKYRQQRIRNAKEYIREIKIKHLRETNEDIDEECVEQVRNIIFRLENENIDMENITKEQYNRTIEIVNNVILEFTRKKIEEGQNINVVKVQASKISDYFVKMQKTRKRVVEDVMDRMQEAILNDYIETTNKKWEEYDNDSSLSDEERYALKKQSMGFSDKVNEIIYGPKGMKALDYIEYVQYAKKEYQTELMPKVTYKMIRNNAKVIVKTGIIRKKFFDPKVTSHIQDEKLLQIMQKKDLDIDNYEKYKKRLDLREEEIRTIKGRAHLKKNYYSQKSRPRLKRLELYKDIYRSIQRQGGRFARNCEDVYNAIPYTTKELFQRAVNENYEENQYLGKEEAKKIKEIRGLINNKFKNSEVTAEGIQELMDEYIEKERQNIEEKVATLICRDYIAGMGDIRIKDLLIKTGYASRRKLDKQDIPSKEENKGVKKLIDNLEKDREIQL